MACFIVSLTTAIITTIFRKKFPEKLNVFWLNLILWGGTIMLIVDHYLNGEIIPSFPFFTKSASQIFPEIVFVGIPMTIAAILFWGILLIATKTTKQIETAKSIPQ